MKVLKRL
jgi:protein phosphatase PTC7